jgi:CxxC motif-containing protein
MSNKQEITCIVCPLGCKILVVTDSISAKILGGNKCKKGVDYAIYEALDPRRMLTTSILVENSRWPLVSVKSSKPIPKDKIFLVLQEIKAKRAKAPIKSGDVLVHNILDMGIDIIATRSISDDKLND